MALMKFLTLNCFIASFILVLFNPCFVLGVSSRNRRNVCVEYNGFINKYKKIHNSLNETNRKAAEEIKKQEPIITKFESMKTSYPEKIIYEMSDQHYTKIGFDHTPIYKKTNFMMIAFSMLLGGQDLLLEVSHARNCYSNLLASVNYFNELKNVNLQSENFLNSKQEMFQFLKKNPMSKCWGTSDREQYMSLLDKEEQTVGKAQQFLDEQNKLVTLQYNCTMNPIDEIIRLSPKQNELIEKFYKSMQTALVPHFNEIKRRLKSIEDEYNSLVNYLSESSHQLKTLNNMKFSDFAVNNVEEVTNIYQKAENLLKSMGSYISNELSTTIKKYTTKLKENLESAATINLKIKINEEIIPSIINDIEELKRVTPSKIQILTNIKPTALGFITKIDEDKFQSNRKDYVLDRTRLDKEIFKFFKDCHNCYNYSYKPDYFKIHTLALQIKEKISQLLSAESQFKKLKEDYDSSYVENKAALETLFNNDIPKFEKTLNEEAIKKQFQVENPTDQINLLVEKKNKWINELSAIEQQISSSDPSSISNEIERLAATLDKLFTNNNKIQRQLSSHPSSIIEPKASNVIKSLTLFLETTKTEVNSYNPKIAKLISLIENNKEMIINEKPKIEKITQDYDKIRNDYKMVQDVKERLSNKVTTSPKEFNTLLTEEIKNLNLNIGMDISNLEKQSAECDASANSLRNKLREVVEGVADLKSSKENLSVKLSNLEKFQSSFGESIENGLDLVGNFDFESFSSLFKKNEETLVNLLIRFKTFKDDKSKIQQYYDKSVDEAKNLIERIEGLNENKNLKQLLADELSPENAFKDFKSLLEEYSKSMGPIEGELNQFVTKLNQYNNDFNKNKQKYETVLSEINLLLDSYNIIKNIESVFNDETKATNLLKINKKLKEKYGLIKSEVLSLKNNKDHLSQLNQKVQEEMIQKTNAIEKLLESLNSFEQSHKSYFSKLENLKVMAEKIQESKNKLSDKKQNLYTFKKSLEEQNSKISEKIKKNEHEFTQLNESQVQQIEKSRNGLSEKFGEYIKGHEGLKNKAENLKTDLSTNLNKKYYELNRKKSELDAKYDDLMKIVKEKLSKGMKHYINEKKQLQENYSSVKSESDSILSKIESLLNNFNNLSSFEDNSIDEIVKSSNQLITHTDVFISKNKNEITSSEYTRNINLIMPDGISDILKEISTAILEEKQYSNVLNESVTSSKPKKIVEPNYNETNMEEKYDSKIEGVEHETEMYSAIEGVAKSVSSKDYFKLITAIGAIAVICLIIGAALLRYKSNKKREIYNKCENIYVHA